jgi:hypothetical protein
MGSCSFATCGAAGKCVSGTCGAPGTCQASAGCSFGRCVTGGSGGDPHLLTLDGLAYDFQGAGEYVLFAARTMTVQVRAVPLGSGPVSIQTALAIATDRDRVTLRESCAERAAHPETPGKSNQPLVRIETGESDARSSPSGCEWQLRLNGEITGLPAVHDLILPHGGRIERRGARYSVFSADGSAVAEAETHPGFLNVHVGHDRADGKTSGLLGNDNENPRDDLTPRDGAPLTEPIAFRDLYSRFGESFRVGATESLFDYLPGENLDTFVDRSFPPFRMDLSYLPVVARRAAGALCREAQVAQGYWFDSCVADVALTGNPEFASSFASSAAPTATLAVLEDSESRECGLRWAGQLRSMSDPRLAVSAARSAVVASDCACRATGGAPRTRSIWPFNVLGLVFVAWLRGLARVQRGSKVS